MNNLYVSIILGLLFFMAGCKEPTFHEKSLNEIHDLKKLGNKIEKENDELRESNQKDIIDKDML